MGRLQALLIALVGFSTLTLATDSVLDVDSVDCSQVSVTENICISSSSPEITKREKTRSDIECLMGCDDLFDCRSAFRDTEGNCYKLSSGFTQISKDVGETSGNLFERVVTGDSSNCDGATCRDSNVCFKGCGGELLDTEMCLGDSRDNCDLTQEFTNARYYWNPVNSDGRDSGTVWLVTYPKIRDDSGIRVIMHNNLRGHHYNPDKCHHWYLTFDGSECSNPATIKQLDYSATNGDYHRASDLDGVCYGLNAGNRQINMNIGPCPGYASTDGHTGWNSPRSMLIMELIPQQAVQVDADKSCPEAAVFNHHYDSWVEHIDVTIDTTSQSHLVKEITYKKIASDTSLRIKYSGLMSVYITTHSYQFCGRWYITINGVECDPIADAIIFHTSTSYTWDLWRHHTRVRTVEGICDNTLAAGTHNIKVVMGACSFSTNQPTRFISGGFNTPSRLYIEEVRREHSVDGIYGDNNAMYRSMTGNLARFHWNYLNDGNDNAVILTMTYVKQFSSTGLRLTSSGNHRTRHCCGYTQCSRWYFTIDNSACSNPGAIEGVSYFNEDTISYQPMQISGVCNNIGAGTRTIRYGVGHCSGYGASEAYTGYHSSFHVFIEELRVDLVKTCSGNPTNCGGP